MNKKLTNEERHKILNNELDVLASQHGDVSVVNRTDNGMNVSYGKPINHILHIIGIAITIWFTVGVVWLGFYIYLLVMKGQKRIRITVNEYGDVNKTKM